MPLFTTWGGCSSLRKPTTPASIPLLQGVFQHAQQLFLQSKVWEVFSGNKTKQKKTSKQKKLAKLGTKAEERGIWVFMCCEDIFLPGEERHRLWLLTGQSCCIHPDSGDCGIMGGPACVLWLLGWFKNSFCMWRRWAGGKKERMLSGLLDENHRQWIMP
jgi:hypothetical protein